MASGGERIAIRVTEEMKAAIEAAAQKAGQTVSDYLRSVVEAAVTGSPTRSAKGDAAATEVKELRADFAAGLEVLGTIMCRVGQKGFDPAVQQRELHRWIEENLRRA